MFVMMKTVLLPLNRHVAFLKKPAFMGYPAAKLSCQKVLDLVDTHVYNMFDKAKYLEILSPGINSYHSSLVQ